MNSQRELDYKIAEFVMGWLWCGMPEGLKLIPPNGNPDESYIVPYYSVVLNMAWEVLETLRSRGFSVDVSCYPDNRKWLKPPMGEPTAKASKWTMQDISEHYQCTITRYDKDFDSWIVVCDPCGSSPAEVICLAALEAVKPK